MKYLTLSQLSKKIGGGGRSTIYRDCESGILPKPIKIGSRLYWIEDQVDEAIALANSQAA